MHALFLKPMIMATNDFVCTNEIFFFSSYSSSFYFATSEATMNFVRFVWIRIAIFVWICKWKKKKKQTKMIHSWNIFGHLPIDQSHNSMVNCAFSFKNWLDSFAFLFFRMHWEEDRFSGPVWRMFCQIIDKQ